jgi:hypothetical protein
VVIHNSLTHITKSVQLNDAKGFSMQHTHTQKENSPNLYAPQTLSFVCGGRGNRLSENRGDARREAILRAWVRMDAVVCGCVAKFMDKCREDPPVKIRIKQWYKNSDVVGACASQNSQDNQAFRKRDCSMWENISNADRVRQLRACWELMKIQGGSNMTGTNCDLFTYNQSRSYLNHLVWPNLCEHTFKF